MITNIRADYIIAILLGLEQEVYSMDGLTDTQKSRVVDGILCLREDIMFWKTAPENELDEKVFRPCIERIYDRIYNRTPHDET